MKIKTSDLIGMQLDWAVAKCEGVAHKSFMSAIDYMAWMERQSLDTDGAHHAYQYSSQWACGGPIIDREGVATREIPPVSGDNGYIFTRRWIAEMFRFPGGPRRSVAYGTTPLVAAMRCYVANKLGAVVEIPEELK